MVETNSSGLYKNSQFDYCRRLPLPRFVQSGFLCRGMVRNGILSCFLFRWRVWKGIPRVCFYFCSAEWNFELFSFPLKGSERKTLLLFLFRGTEFRVVFSSAEGFRAEFWEFSVLRNSRNSVAITTCSVNSADVNFCNQRAHLWVWICPTDKQYDSYRQGMKSRFLFWKWKNFIGFIANLIPYLVPTHFLNF